MGRNKVITGYQTRIVAFLTPMLMLVNNSVASTQQEKEKEMQEVMVRISELQIVSEYLQEYRAILIEEAEASVRLEPGIIAIFPLYKRKSDAGQDFGNLR
jgi:hypothetical protein